MKFHEIKLPTNRKFGLFFTFIFLIFGTFFLYKNMIFIFYILIIFSAILFLFSIIKPEVLLPLNKAWMMFGFLLSKIIGPIIIGLIFFVIFTPISLISKLFGRDELFLRNTKKISYWKIKYPNKETISSFKNQF